MSDRLTAQSEWDRYWSAIELPVEIARGGSRADDAVLDALEGRTMLKGARVLEVGGAPGQFLAYLARRHDIDPHVLDYSEIGCAKTRQNFSALGLRVTVHQSDLFSDDFSEQFDVVYSLGLVEHFASLEAVVARHVRLVRPGGWLVLGCPNFRGPTEWIMRQVAPHLLAQHNLDSMRLDLWKQLSTRLPLEEVFVAYVGGLEPRLWLVREKQGLRAHGVHLAARVARRLIPQQVARWADGPLTSQYVLGVFKRTSDPTKP